MKERLRCKLFGHDFRSIGVEKREGDGIMYKYTQQSDWCRNCGLSKEEVLKLRGKNW